MNLSDIKRYFKDIGCSFEQKQDELKISRFVNGGNFLLLGFYFIFFLFIFCSFLGVVLCETFGGRGI